MVATLQLDGDAVKVLLVKFIASVIAAFALSMVRLHFAIRKMELYHLV